MSELIEEENNDSPENQPEDDIGEHLDGLENGAGCTEIWERLSEQRDNND